MAPRGFTADAMTSGWPIFFTKYINSFIIIKVGFKVVYGFNISLQSVKSIVYNNVNICFISGIDKKKKKNCLDSFITIDRFCNVAKIGSGDGCW